MEIRRLTLSHSGADPLVLPLQGRYRIALIAIENIGAILAQLVIRDGAGNRAYASDQSGNATPVFSSTVDVAGTGNPQIPWDLWVDVTDSVQLEFSGAVATAVVVSFEQGEE